MEELLGIIMLLSIATLLGGCAARVCKVSVVPMYWQDGSTSTMELTVCHPRVRW